MRSRISAVVLAPMSAVMSAYSTSSRTSASISLRPLTASSSFSINPERVFWMPALRRSRRLPPSGDGESAGGVPKRVWIAIRNDNSSLAAAVVIIARRSHVSFVSRRTIDRRHGRAREAQADGKLTAMMDHVVHHCGAQNSHLWHGHDRLALEEHRPGLPHLLIFRSGNRGASLAGQLVESFQ